MQYEMNSLQILYLSLLTEISHTGILNLKIQMAAISLFMKIYLNCHNIIWVEYDSEHSDENEISFKVHKSRNFFSLEFI